LIGQFGSVENLLARTPELSGRVKESLEKNRAQALLSKRLATIICDAPCPVDLDVLKLQSPDEQRVKELLIEFEFNSIGRRLFGEDFKAGRGFRPASPELDLQSKSSSTVPAKPAEDLVLKGKAGLAPAPPIAKLKTLSEVPHAYHVVTDAAERSQLAQELSRLTSFCFATEAAHPDPKQARLLGLAFSLNPQSGFYVPLPAETASAQSILENFRAVLESDRIQKVGHNLKFDISVLKWQGVSVRGKLFDTMVAHSLLEPEMRHSLAFLSETFLGYTPIQLDSLKADNKGPQLSLAEVPLEKISEYAVERVDVALQLRAVLEPMLKEKGQERVFYDVESPLIPVLVDMEYEGIKVDAPTLADFAVQLAKEIDDLEKTICRLAGTNFNLNSPRQLGQILFDVLKICEAPKKTKTGQYATDEQTLAALAPEHEIVQRLLEHRVASKLKSTYADTLPTAIWPKTQRIHTTFNQVATATGRLNSQDPNLQNIPIRTERGQEIRKAFVPRNQDYRLMSADYSQIELRIIAALSHEAGLLEAFKTGADVHTATAARVYGVFPDLVTPEMRRKAKMVNYGIAYGISAFGLAQRLGIPRKEASEIIDQYFKQFPGIRSYMNDTITFARKEGYVQTVTGRRRYMRDVRSSNNTVRSAAERNAINAPIQGTAADMIKVAMVRIHEELTGRQLKSRLLLQVHDELVFDLYNSEEKELRALVEDKMKTAIPLEVPIVVEIGVGENWLEAH
jgi:DNA polymerase-1